MMKKLILMVVLMLLSSCGSKVSEVTDNQKTEVLKEESISTSDKKKTSDYKEEEFVFEETTITDSDEKIVLNFATEKLEK